MPTREQLTNERFDALVNILVAEGILEKDEARWIKSTREFREGPELADGLAKRRE